jgi:hypothetical protein
MSDREAFEKWWPSVGQTIGKVAAWEAWQAAQAQTLLEVIRDTTGCPTKALQHSGEPVVDVNQQLVEALQAVLDCGSTSDQWWIDKAREALLSADKGGEE